MFHAVLLPRPLKIDTVSHPVNAYQNGSALQVFPPKISAYHVLAAISYVPPHQIPPRVHLSANQDNGKEQ